MLWTIIILLILIGVIRKTMSSKSRDANLRRRKAFGVPPKTPIVTHHSGLVVPSGDVYTWKSENGIEFVSRATGAKCTIPLDRILGLQYVQDIQTYTTGGGRSIAGAAVGAVIAGPVGAIVGGRSKTKTKTEDRSLIVMRVKSEAGPEMDVLFKGSEFSYQALSKVLNGEVLRPDPS
ncbi:hypothetical protein GCM10025857_39900 [Alicyclobacillus contaminans]|uniref:hypothetical protein n=1 Tax=Alicyclobacillus contaminans TaxID=392016 RepID=UPI000479DC25|nr:hypothetical protein [Alicyclobacillus contaminans]GMA48680.1 hypothetical protein GCM10025857_00370 [Alicyclobacillus contaminans]GMA52633.1 hypothetical protein GCM10025857_39900 [Alicyclobacillus contaminans]